jgi:hypothetical protein
MIELFRNGKLYVVCAGSEVAYVTPARVEGRGKSATVVGGELKYGTVVKINTVNTSHPANTHYDAVLSDGDVIDVEKLAVLSPMPEKKHYTDLETNLLADSHAVLRFLEDKDWLRAPQWMHKYGDTFAGTSGEMRQIVQTMLKRLEIEGRVPNFERLKPLAAGRVN